MLHSRFLITIALVVGPVAEAFVGGNGRGGMMRIACHARRPESSVAIPPNDNEKKDDYETVSQQNPQQPMDMSRRDCLVSSLVVSTAVTAIWPKPALAAYKPAIRPTAYRVDSTVPPSLLPVADNKKERILTMLGKGSGTDKEAIVIDTVNLNNMLNKAVFGTINAASGLTNPKVSDSGPGFATFVCLGFPTQTADRDMSLAVQIVDSIVKPRKSLPTAVGLSGVPYSAQTSLQAFVQGDMSLQDLSETLLKSGVDSEIVTMSQPLLEYANRNGLDLLALAPEKEDADTARTKGLQFVDTQRRSSYVMDPEGFIALTQDPKYKIYTDRSLLKDFEPRNDKETSGNFYAERILTHEAGATAAAQYASTRPDALVVVMAPVRDVRFLNGINGRIPRVFNKLRPNDGKVTDNSVTTILLNPTARDTLSKSNYMRLEIGTSPDILDYQSKVADYLWFSSSPKVNQIPRLMNG